MARLILTGILVGLAALFAGGIGLRLVMDRPGEAQLQPGEDVAIATLRGPLPRNAFLACPPGYCRVAGAAASPVFATDADRLYWAFLRLATGVPRVTIVADDPRRRRVALIQRSAVFHFPDIVLAEVVARGRDHSSIALYSRARYGRRDFGVNRGRIERWLADLTTLAGQYSPPVPSPGRSDQPGGG